MCFHQYEWELTMHSHFKPNWIQSPLVWVPLASHFQTVTHKIASWLCHCDLDPSEISSQGCHQWNLKPGLSLLWVHCHWAWVFAGQNSHNAVTSDSELQWYHESLVAVMSTCQDCWSFELVYLLFELVYYSITNLHFIIWIHHQISS
jgi:hypothetical protein